MTDTTAPRTMEEELNPEGAKRVKWSEFVETSVLDFFDGHKLEKITVEDGNGNKAKLSRTKDNGIKVEHSSTTIL
ncbi:MAG: hypothetical protein LBL09_00830 [Oscillospiraceae bacterium]|nr:hypothetical protein [Oscillospiraceae bacterium]